MIEEIKMITEQLGAAYWFWGMALGFLIAKLFYWDVFQDEAFDSKNRDEDNRKSGYWMTVLFFGSWIIALILTLTQRVK